MTPPLGDMLAAIGQTALQMLTVHPLAMGATLAALILSLLLRAPRFKGWLGEARVHAALTRRLDPTTHHVFRDVTLPTSRGTTQIDHLIVAPTGVFVIETKAMSGWIFGTADLPNWTQTTFRRKTTFQNPLRQNYRHLKAVEEVLGIAPSDIHGIVAFVGSATPKTQLPDTVVWGVRPLLRDIARPRGATLSDTDRARIVARLQTARLAPGATTRRAHVKQVRQAMADRGPDGTACPTCGAPMVARTTCKTGARFLGCSRYPACRGTRAQDA